MRDDIMLSLVDRAMTDKAFRDRARTDLDGALASADIRLTPEELTAVREFHSTVTGMNDADLDAALMGESRRQFPGGQ